MLGRLISIAIIAAAAYWYWTGPYQQRVNPSYEQKLRNNADEMRLCIRSGNYQLGATGVGAGNVEQRCAEKLNLYQHEGQWHSYDDVRK
ncbi:MAG: hypothetical protein KDI04_02205 [Halieaceae bacterium]|nr:hypothetical protein [Halieaceae bacterium]